MQLKSLASLGLLAGAANAQGGLFILSCSPLTVQRGDPIVVPGQISPHVHNVVGGTGFKFTQSNADARAATNTTCNAVIDKSNYWQPSLYHQGKDNKFELIKLLGIVSTLLSSINSNQTDHLPVESLLHRPNLRLCGRPPKLRWHHWSYRSTCRTPHGCWRSHETVNYTLRPNIDT